MPVDQKVTSFHPNPVPYVTEGSVTTINLYAVAYNKKIFCTRVGGEKPAYLSFSPLPDELSGGPEEYFPFYLNETTLCITFTRTDYFSADFDTGETVDEKDVTWHVKEGEVLNVDTEATNECTEGQYFPYRVSKQEGATSPVYATVRSKSGLSLVAQRSEGTNYRYHDISLSSFESFRKCNASGSEVFVAVAETPVVVDLGVERFKTVQFASGQETALLKVINSGDATVFEWDSSNLPFTFNGTGFPISIPLTDITIDSNDPSRFDENSRAAFLVTSNHYFIQIDNPNFESFEDGSINYLEGTVNVSFLLNGKPVENSTFTFGGNRVQEIERGFALVTVTLPQGKRCFAFETTKSVFFAYSDFNSLNSINTQDLIRSGQTFCNRKNNAGSFTFVVFYFGSANFTFTLIDELPFSWDHGMVFPGNKSVCLVLPPTSAPVIFVSADRNWFTDGNSDNSITTAPLVLQTQPSFICLAGDEPDTNVTVIAQTTSTRRIQLCSSASECGGFACLSNGICDYPVPTSTSSSSSSTSSSKSSTSASSSSSGVVKTTKDITFAQDSTSSSSQVRFTSTVPNAKVTKGSLTVSGKITEEQAENGLEEIEKLLLGDEYDNTTRRFELESVEYSTTKRADSSKINFNVNEVEGSQTSSVSLVTTLQSKLDKDPGLLNDFGLNDAKLDIVSINYAADESTSAAPSSTQVKNIVSSANVVVSSLLLVQILALLL
eukprot:TRINITY_DN2801_c0_g1_i3.p1 TRINITY_DN2801_c0_g1~~TRINITY_DN2801_c0_g1_i3.p1  ORF type:complete len:721 (+),score=180.95 TRINITY_DN2801_c0_g1_i3:733-2895(+)